MKHDNSLPEGFAICLLLVAPVIAVAICAAVWVLR